MLCDVPGGHPVQDQAHELITCVVRPIVSLSTYPPGTGIEYFHTSLVLLIRSFFTPSYQPGPSTGFVLDPTQG